MARRMLAAEFGACGRGNAVCLTSIVDRGGTVLFRGVISVVTKVTPAGEPWCMVVDVR